ncbi:hypothetical protein GALL_115890 [mine drainage metagenome]|uniref:Glycosyltransferase RgtA/B/C/D-like domain-containing protein n=1 Tax=mine drainage metagenome TaxID=410659 RepID=A0A1J5SDD8_9ZZZZ
MTFIGLLSVISACFVPGAIAVLILPLRQRPFASLLTVLFFSLVYTHLEVVLLTALHLYCSTTVYALFAAEAALLGYLLMRRDPKPEFEERVTPDGLVLALIVVVVLAWIFATANLGRKSLFQGWAFWDAVVSWNRWALLWADGKFPSQTNGYPQMLPSLWSYAYVFVGTRQIELFANQINNAFILAVPLIAMDLALRRRIAMLGGVLAGFWFFAYSPLAMWTFQGSADAPLAATCLAVFYACHLFYNEKNSSAKQAQYFIAAGLAAVAAIVKQQGMLFALLVPPLLALDFPKGKRLRSLLWAYVLALVITGPWYGYYLAQFATGAEQTNVGKLDHLTSVLAKTDSVWKRAMRGVGMWSTMFGPHVVTLILPAVVAAGLALARKWRAMIVIFVIGYFFIWSYAFSYDIRNSVMAAALVAFVCGLAAEGVAGLVPRRERQREQRSRWLFRFTTRQVILVMAAGSLIFAGLVGHAIPDTQLTALQHAANTDKGHRDVNLLLYKAMDLGLMKGFVKTNYEVMCYDPYFKDVHLIFTFFQTEGEVKSIVADRRFKTVVIWKRGQFIPTTVRDLLAGGFKPMLGNEVVEVYCRD